MYLSCHVHVCVCTLVHIHLECCYLGPNPVLQLQELQFRSFIILATYFSHMGPDLTSIWARFGPWAVSLTPLIKVINTSVT